MTVTLVTVEDAGLFHPPPMVMTVMEPALSTWMVMIMSITMSKSDTKKGI